MILLLCMPRNNKSLSSLIMHATNIFELTRSSTIIPAYNNGDGYKLTLINIILSKTVAYCSNTNIINRMWYTYLMYIDFVKKRIKITNSYLITIQPVEYKRYH